MHTSLERHEGSNGDRNFIFLGELSNYALNALMFALKCSARLDNRHITAMAFNILVPLSIHIWHIALKRLDEYSKMQIKFPKCAYGTHLLNKLNKIIKLSNVT